MQCYLGELTRWHTACSVPGVVRNISCLGDVPPPSYGLGRGICSHWQIEKGFNIWHFTGLQSSCRERRLSSSFNTVVNQKQANDAMWVCMGPNVLYSVLILGCLLWFQLQILHPSTRDGSCVGFFLFRSRFFQTLIILSLPRGVGSLCCYRCYSHHRTEPPFFLPCYTKLLLVFPPNCMRYFSLLCLFPLHLERCCLYGAFRKQMSCAIETWYYFRLVAVRACARDQMRCSVSCFWDSACWSISAFISVSYRKGLKWHF